MANDQSPVTGNRCPHCGKPPGLRFWHLLPSSTRERKIRCRACQGLFDVADGSRMASVLGGLAGMAPAVFFLFAPIVKAGGGSRLSMLAGSAVVAACFGLGSIIFGRLTLRLVPRR